MKFGSKVLVHRGGHSAKEDVEGSHRFVTGVLIGRKGGQSRVRLTEDDPLDTVGWCQRGDVGHWGSSMVIPFPANGTRPDPDEWIKQWARRIKFPAR